MATVPDIQNVPAVSPARDPGESFSVDQTGASQDIAALAVQAGRFIGRLRQQRQQAEDDSFTTSVQARARIRFSDLASVRSQNATEGAEDFAEGLEKELGQMSEEIITEAREAGARPSDRGIQQARQNLTRLRAGVVIQAGIFENNARVEMIGRRLGESLDDLALAAFNDPSAIDALILEARADIELSRGALAAGTLADLRETAERDITEAAVRGTIDTDPELAVEMLDAGDFDEGLTATTKATLVRAAQKAMASDVAESVRLAEKAEKDAEKAHKQQQKTTARELYGLAQDGELQRDVLDEADVELSDFKALLKQIETPVTEDDIDVYVDLDSRARSGQDVRDDAESALRDGSITPGSFDRIIGRSEKALDANSPSTPFDRGMDFISSGMKPNQLNPAVGAPQRYANAQADFNAFFDRNSEASVDEAMKEARRIVSEFSILELDQITLTLRKPTFLTGGRLEPDLDETEARTLEAFETGQIDAAEFGRQAVLIQRWRETRERFQQMQEQK